MTAENPLAQFQRGFALGWAGGTLDKGEPALVTAAYKAGRKARAEDEFYRSKEAEHD